MFRRANRLRRHSCRKNQISPKVNLVKKISFYLYIIIIIIKIKNIYYYSRRISSQVKKIPLAYRRGCYKNKKEVFKLRTQFLSVYAILLQYCYNENIINVCAYVCV